MQNLKNFKPPKFFSGYISGLKLWYFVDKQVMFEKGTDVVEGTEKTQLRETC